MLEYMQVLENQYIHVHQRGRQTTKVVKNLRYHSLSTTGTLIKLINIIKLKNKINLSTMSVYMQVPRPTRKPTEVNILKLE